MIQLYRDVKRKKEQEAKPLPEKNITIPANRVKVSTLPNLFGYTLAEIMKVFLEKGFLVNINSEIDNNTIIDVAKEFNITAEIEDTSVEEEIGLKTKVLEIDEASKESEDLELRIK